MITVKVAVFLEQETRATNTKGGGRASLAAMPVKTNPAYLKLQCLANALSKGHRNSALLITFETSNVLGQWTVWCNINFLKSYF